jgi:hypothetical protein
LGSLRCGFGVVCEFRCGRVIIKEKAQESAISSFTMVDAATGHGGFGSRQVFNEINQNKIA